MADLSKLTDDELRSLLESDPKEETDLSNLTDDELRALAGLTTPPLEPTVSLEGGSPLAFALPAQASAFQELAQATARQLEEEKQTQFLPAFKQSIKDGIAFGIAFSPIATIAQTIQEGPQESEGIREDLLKRIEKGEEIAGKIPGLEETFEPKTLTEHGIVFLGPISPGSALIKTPKVLLRRGMKLTKPAARKGVNPDIIDEAMTQASKDVDDFVNQKIIPSDFRDAYTQKAFLENLERRGIVQNADDILPGRLERGILNKSEVASQVDRTLGTRLQEATEELIQAEFKHDSLRADMLDSFAVPIASLKKQGVDSKQITRWMQHMETAEDGTIFFNPKSMITEGFIRPKFSGPGPNSKQLTDLIKLRKTFNDIVQQNPEFAGKIGHIQGYVPILRKRTGIRVTDLKPGSTRNVEETFFMRPRTATHFDDQLHETDFEKLVAFYANSAAKHVAFNKVLPKFQQEIMKLRFMGRGNEAQFFGNHLARTMGIRRNLDLDRLFAHEVTQAHQGVLEAIAQQTVAPRKFLDEATNSMKKIMFDSLVFTNPRTIVKQVMQPELVGSGEIGFKWIRKGRMLDLKKSMRKEAMDQMDLMRERRADHFAELRYDKTKNKFLQAVEKVSSFVAKPGKYIFSNLDVRNRRVAFLGAREQFRQEARKNIDNVLDGLLEGEKNTIRNIMQRDGFDAAANMYGIMRARRINYAYGMADSPEFFAEGIGRHIPFTTWSRNQLARVVGDVKERNIKKLAARAVKPLVFLSVLQLLTGYKVPGAHPLASITGVAALQPFPGPAQVAEDIQIRGTIPTALSTAEKFTPAGPIRRTLRDIDRAKTGQDAFAEGFLRLRKGKKNDFVEQFRKEILREF